jgi:hypothetical protein
MNHYLPCPEWADLLALRQESLSPAECAALDAHVMECPACAATRADYLRLIAHLRSAPELTIQPLPGLALHLRDDEQDTGVKWKQEREAVAHARTVRRPVRAFLTGLAVASLIFASHVLHSLHEWARAGHRLSADLRRIVARLLPPQSQLALGVRGSQAVWPRRYTAEDVSIDVQLERAANPKDTLQLIGFVTRKGVTVKTLQGTAVHLSSHAQTVYTQTIDELGNFVFSPIIPATYTLEVLFPDGIVVIEQLLVTAQD